MVQMLTPLGKERKLSRTNFSYLMEGPRYVLRQDIDSGKEALGFKIGHASDIGKLRTRQEDSHRVCTIARPGKTPQILAIVADGLGAQEKGNEASAMATQIIPLRYVYYLEVGLTDEYALAHAVYDAHKAVKTLATDKDDVLHSHPGTTVNVVLLNQNGSGINIRIGDSRGYIATAGKYTPDRLAADQSLVEQYLEFKMQHGIEGYSYNGIGDDYDRYQHPERNILLTYLGDPYAQFTIEKLSSRQEGRLTSSEFVRRIQVQPGQRLVLCSDGIWEMIYDEEIQETLQQHAFAHDAATALINKANENGGEDNSSVIVLENPAKYPRRSFLDTHLISAVIDAQPNATRRRQFNLRHTILKDPHALLFQREIHPSVRAIFETPVTPATTDLVYPMVYPRSTIARWHITDELQLIYSTADTPNETDARKRKLRQMPVATFLMHALAAQEYDGEILIPFIGRDILGRKKYTLKISKEDFRMRMNELWNTLESRGFGNEAQQLFLKFSLVNPALNTLFFY